jgi:D-aminopeptidase
VCSPRLFPLHLFLATISTARVAPGHDSLKRLARSLVSPVTTASAKEAHSRVARSEPTSAVRAETVAVPVQHTIDALVADQPLSRFQSPGQVQGVTSPVEQRIRLPVLRI